MHDVFFFTDIHGQKDLYYAIKKWCYLQDPNCMIIYGGDAADRGQDGYEIMKDLLNDWHINYLYGNHEELFVQAADAIIGAYAKNDASYYLLHHCDYKTADNIINSMRENDFVKIHLQNEGTSTLIGWLLDGAPEWFVDTIRTLPRTISYGNKDFCHAGGTYTTFRAVADAEYSNTMLPAYAENHCIWDRNCLALGWETGRFCIHGHTPTIALPRALYGRDVQAKATLHPAIWGDHMGGKHKRGGFKIDMDTGAAWTGRAFVLNCLTMKATGFYDANIVEKNTKEKKLIEQIETYKLI